MLTVHPIGDREEILKRIIFLGGSLVGCGKICTCRAKLAMVLTADQMTKVEALAADVQFGRSHGGVAAVRAIIGDSPNAIQQEVLAEISATSQHPEYLRTKESGGRVAAESSLDELIEQHTDPES